MTWTPRDRPITLLVVDLPSEIWIARDPLLCEVNALIEGHRPDLVVGDFNAPRRSRGLAALPAGYQHAYHTAGGGWGYTWPVPVPVYAIDHCLHGPRISPAAYRLGGLGGDSDHRYQVFDFFVAVP
ncbi:MAG TPA: endonuclease/exonuclease/phosphatase family protein [Urbifossiella sp.]|nr:endonuclease/exonuclease/phosphatase family protein [Urbifossiella sp.]